MVDARAAIAARKGQFTDVTLDEAATMLSFTLVRGGSFSLVGGHAYPEQATLLSETAQELVSGRVDEVLARICTKQARNFANDNNAGSGDSGRDDDDDDGDDDEDDDDDNNMASSSGGDVDSDDLAQFATHAVRASICGCRASAV